MGLLNMMGMQESRSCDVNNGDPTRCTAPLYPRWRNHDVMGEDGKAMGYLCQRCQQDFLPQDVAIRLARAEAEAAAVAAQAAAEAAAAKAAKEAAAAEAEAAEAEPAEAAAE